MAENDVTPEEPEQTGVSAIQSGEFAHVTRIPSTQPAGYQMLDALTHYEGLKGFVAPLMKASWSQLERSEKQMRAERDAAVSELKSANEDRTDLRVRIAKCEERIRLGPAGSISNKILISIGALLIGAAISIGTINPPPVPRLWLLWPGIPGVLMFVGGWILTIRQDAERRQLP
jgi:hypothetical protein